MGEDTNPVAVAIGHAQEHLQEALRALVASPASDPAAIAYAAHALMDYLQVMTGTLDLVVSSLPVQTAGHGLARRPPASHRAHDAHRPPVADHEPGGAPAPAL